MAAGVTRLIAVGVNLDRSSNAVSLGHAYEEVWAGVGHHPLEISEPDLATLNQMAKDEMVVVVGEIGLDFEHVGGPHRDLQIQRLNEMFSLATEHDLPVSIHNRGAAEELLPPEIRENPVLYPAPEALARGEWFQSQPLASQKLRDRLWTEIKSS